MLNHRSVLVCIKSAGAGHQARHRAIQRIEALALDFGPYPECRDAERAGAEGPEETAEGRSDEGTCTCKLLTKLHYSSWNLPNALQSSAYNPPSRSRRRPASRVSPS